ncbi:hypothetical protein [Brevundimonas diminuta]|uniref:Uncharacterized protein n=1 Tax=Brevundimonas diminuta TaxID=293 RepID=A0A2X1B6Q6_BREDI|nr:hypothetical protein [Brevundimonas diminuta]SPU46504.1 Uncharacterised protein [Brevundimonas diminuta]
MAPDPGDPDHADRLRLLPAEPATTPSAAVTSESFIAAAARIDAESLSALAAAVDADPAGVANQLQSGLGGRRALQAYAAAMLEDGQAAHLGRQWAALTADVPALSASEQKDGGVWRPRAEDAGFFTGGIAAALSQNPKALPDFAQGAGVARPLPARTSPNGCHNASAPCLAPPATPSTRPCTQARCAKDPV